MAVARGICLLVALAGVLATVAVTPDAVARLSPDGELNRATVAAVQVLRVLALMLAAGALFVARHQRIADFVGAAVLANTGIATWAVAAAATGLALNASGLLVASSIGRPANLLFRDPNAIAGQPAYYGALEYAGIMLMAGAAAVALFASTLSTGAARRHLMLGGLLTFWLVLDDVYMLHEQSPAVYLNERTVFGIYIVLFLAFALTNRSQLLQSPFFLLFTAGGLFAAAMTLDSYSQLGSAENMLELMGFCFWSVYFVVCSRRALAAAVDIRRSAK